MTKRKIVMAFFPVGTPIPSYRCGRDRNKSFVESTYETLASPNSLYTLSEWGEVTSRGEWAIIYEDDPLNPNRLTSTPPNDWGEYSL